MEIMHGRRRPRLLALLVALAACGGEERKVSTPAESLVAFREMRLGRAVDSAGKVVAPADSFGPRDTVHLSLDAEGSVDRLVLTSRWTREDDVVVAQRQRVLALEGRETVTFAVADSAGLPAGEYVVRVHHGTDEIGTETFRVVSERETVDREEASDQ
ncbi:MAG: hypothetical protein KY397_07335 [Gemmatimonadetes bacterium]|nr:hypothetical protein [Gemmatimonadota bacterium]